MVNDTSILALPDPEYAAQREREARSLFGRSLASWASDVLSLRASGLIRPVWMTQGEEGDSWSRAA